ncbi:hypothetical protein P9272_33160 [Mesorhizobium sp. WSM4976]|uniref:hypothetical protein n=1 Tax=Mesorhizobium sp. WSM4976 TaxID=3038549 RepID=UPI002415EC17|nr:hypothetical protein [Mesorhizobium sp. WSM4976]MDG4898383.1 hypothetical protein [Mesorhizobium sp. WSM4976]
MRVQTDRLAGARDRAVAAVMVNEPPCAAHVVEIRDDKGDAVTVALDAKFYTLPPIGKQKRYSRSHRVGPILRMSAAVPLNLSRVQNFTAVSPRGTPCAVTSRLECIRLPHGV